jgi:hypothetical protein
LKWVFGFNEETLWYDNYVRYIKCAVNSCKRNAPSLEPVFMYDGYRGALTEWLESKGVTVIIAKSPLCEHFRGLERERGFGASTACGAFLRVEIPRLMQEQGWDDSHVLYTDCDVMFLKPISFDVLPEYFSCAPEFNMNNWSYFNSGSMLINVPKMRETYNEFIDYILTCGDVINQSYDQGCLNEFYKGKWSRLNPAYNWKPYWGVNSAARIVHFHGAKIENIEKILANKLQGVPEVCVRMFRSNPEAYRTYGNLAKRFEKG